MSPPAAQSLRGLVHARSTKSAGVRLHEDRRRDHSQESDERRQVTHREEEDRQDQRRDQRRQPPLQLAQGIRVDRRRPDLTGQVRVGRAQIRLYLTKDPLLLL
ncbi:MAG: hypothetical protein V9E94_13650 [Microthrixaceae bacterium]